MLSSKQGVLIIRVSDPKQEREGLSLDNQEQVLRAYAEEAGIKIIREFRFQESADHKIRRRFHEVISYVKARKSVTCIVGYRVDRMTRNYHDHVLLDELRLDGGKELHFVHDRLVISRETVGRDIQEWDTKVYLAKQYLNRLKEDAIVSARYKISRGEWPGKAPFGYRNVKVNNRSIVIPDEPKAAVVRGAFLWYASGAYSMEQVRGKILGEFGLNMSKGKLDFVLKNPFYYGEMLFKGERYSHVYKPLISHSTYEKTLMVKEAFHKQPHKFAGLDFTYRGLARCTTCGCILTPERKRKGDYEYVYYHCTEYHGKHGAAWFREEDLTKRFQALLDSLQIPPEELTRIVNALRESEHSREEYATDTRRRIEAERTRQEQRRTVLWDDRLDGLIAKEQYIEKLKEIEDEIKSLSRNLADIVEADAEYYHTAIYILELCANAGAIFRESTASETRRTLLKLVLQNCEVNEKTLVWELKKPFDSVFDCVGRQTWLPLLNLFRAKQIPLEVNFESLETLRFSSPRRPPRD